MQPWCRCTESFPPVVIPGLLRTCGSVGWHACFRCGGQAAFLIASARAASKHPPLWAGECWSAEGVTRSAAHSAPGAPWVQMNFGAASQDMGDMEAMELAELNVVYDHSDDGELMQLLFGIGGVCVCVLMGAG